MYIYMMNSHVELITLPEFHWEMNREHFSLSEVPFPWKNEPVRAKQKTHGFIIWCSPSILEA